MFLSQKERIRKKSKECILTKIEDDKLAFLRVKDNQYAYEFEKVENPPNSNPSKDQNKSQGKDQNQVPNIDQAKI